MRNVLESDLCYPAPRWQPLAWFVRSGFAPIPEIENGLRSTLFRRMSSLVTASIAHTTVMMIVVSRHFEGAYLVWAVMGCILEVIRLVDITVIGRFIATRSLHRARYAVDLFVATSLLWALQLGCGCILCLWSGDIAMMIFSIVLAVGVIGGVSGRNPGSPRLSAAQMILILLPLTAGLLFFSGSGVRLLALLCPPYLWGMWSINFQLHDDYVAMLTAQWENRHRALHCSLTGLRNVRHFHELLTAAIATQNADPVAVLALDLDGFKAVNDRYGHPMGDALLRSVAERIRLFESPTVLGARIGGDEFALVVQGQDARAAESLAEKLIHEISRPHNLANVAVEVGVSIGIARCRSTAVTPAALYAQADKALYRAKQDSKGQWWVYTDEGMGSSNSESFSVGRDAGLDDDGLGIAQHSAIRPDRDTKAA